MTRTLVHERTVLGGVSVREADSGGKFLIKIIEGDVWGSSGYYPAEVIKRDGPKVFAAGTQIYLDHPTESELWDRPERSIRDLAGAISSTPTWNEESKALEAEATFFGQYTSMINEIKDHVGMSINAYAVQEYGTIGDQTGPITVSLVEAVSVDVVTKAGAGGAIVKAIESARAQFLAGHTPGESTRESEQVADTKVGISDETAIALTAAMTALTTALQGEQSERAAAAEAARKTAEEAAKPDVPALVGALAEAKLPSAYARRATEAVLAGMPVTDAIAAAKAEVETILKESGVTPGAAPLGVPQSVNGATSLALPGGLTVDISEARVNKALGRKVS